MKIPPEVDPTINLSGFSYTSNIALVLPPTLSGPSRSNSRPTPSARLAV